MQDRLAAGHALSAAEVAHLFTQLCAGLEALHSLEDPLAHKDVKPHNILLRKGLPPALRQQSLARGGTADADADGAHLVAKPALAGPGTAASEDPSPSLPSELLHAVLMDFGSAGPAVVHVASRAGALAVQESAERYSTAPYRAPELWDVPSFCTVDERVDVWAAGCVLFYLMVGETPFEMAANEAGGSLMLAIVK